MDFLFVSLYDLFYTKKEIELNIFNKLILDNETLINLEEIGCIMGRLKSLNKIILNLISMDLDADINLLDIVILHLLMKNELKSISDKINTLHLKFGI